MEMRGDSPMSTCILLLLHASLDHLPSQNWNEVASSCGYALIFVVRFTNGKFLGLKRENAGRLFR